MNRPGRPLRRALLAALLSGGAAVLAACADGQEPTYTLVEAGESHTCAIDSRGGAWCWGSNRYGQLGDGTATTRLRPVRVAGDLTFRAVALGSTHTCAIDTGGDPWCWGGNFVGKLGDGTNNSSPVPVRVAGIPGPVDTIDATSDRSCAMSAGDLWCWGDNTQGAFGTGPRGPVPRPYLVLEGGVRAHDMSPGRGCVTRGGVLCVGIDVDGDQPEDAYAGEPLEGAPSTGFAEIQSGQFIVCGRTDDGRVFCWGSMAWRTNDDGSWEESVWLRADEVPGVRAASLAMMESTLCTLSSGRVECRGGRPGEGWVRSGGKDYPMFTVAALGEPWDPGFRGEVSDIAGGAAHVCVVVSGDVWCAGENFSGQLGDGTTSRREEPVRVRTD